MNLNHSLQNFVLLVFHVFTFPLGAQMRNLRAVLIASVEDHEGVRFPKKVLFIQFVSAELHCSTVLQTNEHKQRERN